MELLQNARLGVNLLGHNLLGHRFPAHVAIAVTNKCNLNCAYCYSQTSGSFGEDMTTEEIFSLVGELYRMGTRYIVLTGGEPLVRKDIKQIIDHIAGKGMKCAMSSNGLLLTQRLDAVENLSSINISLDGDEEEHVRNRGRQDYQKVIQAVETAVSCNIIVAIGCVLTRNNMNCIHFIANLAKEKGCRCYFHIPYWRASTEGDRGYTECPPMTMEETSRVMKEIVEHQEAGYPINYSPRMHSYLHEWPFPTPTVNAEQLRQARDFDPIPCLAGDCYCIIDADSSVYPCASLIGQVPALKAKEVGFRKAWDHLPTVRCAACHFFLQNELNLLFSLDMSTWRNLVKTLPHLFRKKKQPQA